MKSNQICLQLLLEISRNSQAPLPFATLLLLFLVGTSTSTNLLGLIHLDDVYPTTAGELHAFLHGSSLRRGRRLLFAFLSLGLVVAPVPHRQPALRIRIFRSIVVLGKARLALPSFFGFLQRCGILDPPFPGRLSNAILLQGINIHTSDESFNGCECIRIT
jgi:hypothetical protein